MLLDHGAEASSLDKADHSNGDGVSSNPATVLIVDDEPMNIEVLRSMLEAEGVSCDTALSGR